MADKSTAEQPAAPGKAAAGDSAAKAGAAAKPDAGAAAPAAPDAGTSRTTDVTPGPGGVMTDEAGVVTGPLTLKTEYADGAVTVRVQYKDADEWYAVTGAHAALADPAGLDAVHAVAVALTNRPEG
jgi:hypothetical protein